MVATTARALRLTVQSGYRAACGQGRRAGAGGATRPIDRRRRDAAERSVWGSVTGAVTRKITGRRHDIA
jgi:hypothetical protein